MDPRIEIVPTLTDNYSYIVREKSEDAVAIVDPGEADPVMRRLEALQLSPTEIWLTHKHQDHIGGAVRLARKYDLLIRAPSQVPFFDARTTQMNDGDSFSFGSTWVKVFRVAGHTREHVVYLMDRTLFAGDVLFVGGCGRVFEGTAREFYREIERLIGPLSDDVRIFSGHEYAEKNLRFVLEIDPDNHDAACLLGIVRRMRGEGKPAMPTELGRERLINPFLRAREPSLLAALKKRYPDVPDAPADVFAFVRRLRDAC